MSPKDNKNKSSKKKREEKMRTRKDDSKSSRKTKRSSSTYELYDDNKHNKNKKKKVSAINEDEGIHKYNKIIKKSKENKIQDDSSDSDSEYSRSKFKKGKRDQNNDLKKHIESESDSGGISDEDSKNSTLANDNDSSGNISDDVLETVVEEPEPEDEPIEEEVQSNASGNYTKNNEKKKAKIKTTTSLFSAQTIQALRYYARNGLFQKIKILNETHLESNGKIIEEALKLASSDIKSTTNLNAYIIECHQILKRNVCSRRGYVKRQIGEQLKGKFVESQ